MDGLKQVGDRLYCDCNLFEIKNKGNEGSELYVVITNAVFQMVKGDYFLFFDQSGEIKLCRFIELCRFLPTGAFGIRAIYDNIKKQVIYPIYACSNKLIASTNTYIDVPKLETGDIFNYYNLIRKDKEPKADNIHNPFKIMTECIVWSDDKITPLLFGNSIRTRVRII